MQPRSINLTEKIKERVLEKVFANKQNIAALRGLRCNNENQLFSEDLCQWICGRQHIENVMKLNPWERVAVSF